MNSFFSDQGGGKQSQFLTLFSQAPEDCPTMGNGPDLRNKNTVNNVNEIRSGMIFVHLLDTAISMDIDGTKFGG